MEETMISCGSSGSPPLTEPISVISGIAGSKAAPSTASYEIDAASEDDKFVYESDKDVVFRNQDGQIMEEFGKPKWDKLRERRQEAAKARIARGQADVLKTYPAIDEPDTISEHLAYAYKNEKGENQILDYGAVIRRLNHLESADADPNFFPRRDGPRDIELPPILKQQFAKVELDRVLVYNGHFASLQPGMQVMTPDGVVHYLPKLSMIEETAAYDEISQRADLESFNTAARQLHRHYKNLF